MTIASIDIGSNTVLLLVAKYNSGEQTITPLANYYQTPRLSEGLSKVNKINQSKIDLLDGILSHYKKISSDNNCTVILAKATNAFRIASNSEEIIEKIRTKHSIEVEIISGDEEARLTFLGTSFPFNFNKCKTVIDIGGGSTEIIYGDQKEILFTKSFHIGVVSLTEKFFLPNPPSDKMIDDAKKYINEIFLNLPDKIPPETETLAVAGTPTTLSCIKQNLRIFNDELVDNSVIALPELEEMIFLFSPLKKEEILEKFGEVVRGREDVILAGSIILCEIMKRMSLSKITVSTKGLRYGSVIDYLIKNYLITTDK